MDYRFTGQRELSEIKLPADDRLVPASRRHSRPEREDVGRHEEGRRSRWGAVPGGAPPQGLDPYSCSNLATSSTNAMPRR